MTINTFLFDLDDTIIDTKVYAKMYLPVLSMIKKKLGISDRELILKAEELGIVKNKFDRWDTGDLCRGFGLLDEYYKILEKYVEVVPALRKDVIYFFRKAKKLGKTIGIVSNSMKRTIEAFLNKYKLNGYIGFVYSFDDAGCKKRELKYWKQLIKKYNLNVKECVIIGDDVRDDSVVPFNAGLKGIILDEFTDLRYISKRLLI